MLVVKELYSHAIIQYNFDNENIYFYCSLSSFYENSIIKSY